MGYRVVNGVLYPIENFQSSKVSYRKSKEPEVNFQQVLKNNMESKESFTISNHAAERLNNRNVIFDEADMKKINDGINMAKEKGARDSLILYKDVALLASIKNRTIITAVPKEEKNEAVFTNIDSVVLL